MKKCFLGIATLTLLCVIGMTACNNSPVSDETLPVAEETEAVTEETAETTESVEIEEELPEIHVYLAGGSIVNANPYDDGYHVECGYGSLLKMYMNEKAIIHNYGSHGFTVMSYQKNGIYETLKTELKAGDYLLIAFGHNEFSSAAKSYTEKNSFSYYLYEYYVKLAREAGAIPILCTPIVKLAADNDYTGKAAHITSSGDYRQAIIDLGEALDIAVVDMTSVSRTHYEEIGYEEAAKYHAVKAGKYGEDGTTLTADMDTVNTTNLNYYGAKYMAYRLANELKNMEGIGAYVKTDAVEPTMDAIECNPYYEMPADPLKKADTNIYIVGDSTASRHNDKDLLYPKYGYGTQLDKYVTENAVIHNLAISGSSSKSYILYPQYETIKTNLKAGDYLLIGFGHNDATAGDTSRFTDATKDYTDPESFGYHLYEYYIKLARDAGATPILCTPIVYADAQNNYTGDFVHNRSYGNYHQAILDVAEAYDVPVVDLTEITKTKFKEIGFEEAIKYYGGGKYKSDLVTVDHYFGDDTTHLNMFGADYVAYRLACELQNIEGISEYIQETLTEPTIDELKPFPHYLG